MLNILIPGSILLLCIAGIIISKIIWNSTDKQMDKLTTDINQLAYLDRNLTEIETKRWKNLRNQQNKLYNKRCCCDKVDDVAGIVIIPAGIWLGIAVVALVLSITPVGIKHHQIKNQARYRTIMTELDSPEVRDSLNIRMKDIVDEAIEWNADYDCYIINHNSPWLNWYNPLSVLDGVDKIDIDNYI